jgi:hypothetical protein
VGIIKKYNLVKLQVLPQQTKGIEQARKSDKEKSKENHGFI